MSKIEQKFDTVLEILNELGRYILSKEKTEENYRFVLERTEKVRQFIIQVQEAIKAIETKIIELKNTTTDEKPIDEIEYGKYWLKFTLNKLKALGEETT